MPLEFFPLLDLVLRFPLRELILAVVSLIILGIWIAPAAIEAAKAVVCTLATQAARGCAVLFILYLIGYSVVSALPYVLSSLNPNTWILPLLPQASSILLFMMGAGTMCLYSYLQTLHVASKPQNGDNGRMPTVRRTTGLNAEVLVALKRIRKACSQEIRQLKDIRDAEIYVDGSSDELSDEEVCVYALEAQDDEWVKYAANNNVPADVILQELQHRRKERTKINTQAKTAGINPELFHEELRTINDLRQHITTRMGKGRILHQQGTRTAIPDEWKTLTIPEIRQQLRQWDDDVFVAHMARRGIQLSRCPNCNRLENLSVHQCFVHPSPKVEFKGGLPLRNITTVSIDGPKVVTRQTKQPDLGVLRDTYNKAVHQYQPTSNLSREMRATTQHSIVHEHEPTSAFIEDEQFPLREEEVKPSFPLLFSDQSAQPISDNQPFGMALINQPNIVTEPSISQILNLFLQRQEQRDREEQERRDFAERKRQERRRRGHRKQQPRENGEQQQRGTRTPMDDADGARVTGSSETPGPPPRCRETSQPIAATSLPATPVVSPPVHSPTPPSSAIMPCGRCPGSRPN